MNDLIGPFAVGALSAAANVVERNAIKDNSKNQFLKEASLFGDVLIGAYSVANYSGMLGGMGFPRTGTEGATLTAGAGVGLLTKRIAEWIGGNVLELPGWQGANGSNGASRMLRGGMGRFRKPSSAVETGVQPRKRQFFSVV
tara:strand:- start:255 stop:680 length:426 start_codon:yes stop_codon:yes gene_type:complete